MTQDYRRKLLEDIRVFTQTSENYIKAIFAAIHLQKINVLSEAVGTSDRIIDHSVSGPGLEASSGLPQFPIKSQGSLSI